MNKKVIKTMIFLVIIELIAWYILKIFFPNEFIMQISNPQIIMVGNYIDSHTWLRVICIYITAFITYFFYICAVCRNKKLDIIEIVLVLIIISISIALEYCLPDLLTIFNVLAMFGLPLLLKADFNTTYKVFAIHTISQYLSLNIRGLNTTTINLNYATFFLMTLECYFWLFLLYLYYNYKDKER